MVRTLFFLVFIGGVSIAAFKWANSGDAPDRFVQGRKPEDSKETDQPAAPTEGPLTKSSRVKDSVQRRDPFVISDARVNLISFPELAAQRTGKVLFLGTKVPDKDVKSDAEMVKFARAVTRSFLAIETTQQELTKLQVQGYKVPGDDRLWREWQRDTDPIETGKMNVVRVKEWYTLLKDGSRVKENELVGMIDPQLTEAELFIKLAKLVANQSEVRAAIKTKDEAKVRYERYRQLLAIGGAGREEVDGYMLTWERYKEEEEVKKANVDVAKREIAQTEGVLRQHEIRSPLSGFVRRVYKQPDESLKEQEPVLRLEGFDAFQVEAFVGEQLRRKMTEGMPVIVEAVRREGPEDKLEGHRQPVTAVAVAQDAQGRKLVVSAGEDRAVCVWELSKSKNHWVGKEIVHLEMASPVRSLACTPPGSKLNLCMLGATDGTSTLLNLDDLGDEKQYPTLKHTHRGVIYAVAFSPDGKWCATAGEDKSIFLYDSATGERTGEIINAHKGAVTSLAFTNDGLISAGRDNRMVLWPIENGQRSAKGREIDQRTGQVEQLGVVMLPRTDGKEGKQVSVLFDQGNSLRILNPTNWSMRSVLQNPPGSTPFTNFALFSPDGRVILTAGSADNRLQLWTNPVTHAQGRGAELRQYIWDHASTCAAFDPQSQFVVTGTTDNRVLVWTLPTEAELKEPAIEGVIRHVGQALDSSSRQVRVLVDVPRKSDYLLPGDKATLVIYPK